MLFLLFSLSFSFSIYSFLCSTFFTNANMGACVAALIYFLLFFLQLVVLIKLGGASSFVIALMVSEWVSEWVHLLHQKRMFILTLVLCGIMYCKIFPSSFLLLHSIPLSLPLPLPQCLMAPIGFGLGSSFLVQYELLQTGQQFNNLFTSPVRVHTFCICSYLIIII